MFSTTHDFSKSYRSVEYNFGMPMMFYVQIGNNPQPCKIEAEKIEELGMQNTTEGRLIFKNAKDEKVGSFRSDSVIGWWKQFD
ncbi:MAG: hypothetical protein ABSH37_03590 [Bryobacteraceae bacterium]